jgi:hypothetical protein
LFAAQAGGIDLFNGSFSKVNMIATPTAISNLGLVPFNVQSIGDKVYVTYAPAGAQRAGSSTAGTGNPNPIRVRGAKKARFCCAL